MHEHGPIDQLEGYGNLNEGAGLAIYASEKTAPKIVEMAHRLSLGAFVAGHIEEGDKKVVISPLGLEFAAETLAVR